MALAIPLCPHTGQAITTRGCALLQTQLYLRTVGKSQSMNRFEPMDPRRWKRGARDMGQGHCFLLPDHGREFKRDDMRKLGFTLYQDFVMKQDDNYEMRWWFRNTETWKSRIDRIEQMGYVASDKLQIT
jgi:hypothetical protein